MKAACDWVIICSGVLSNDYVHSKGNNNNTFLPTKDVISSAWSASHKTSNRRTSNDRQRTGETSILLLVTVDLNMNPQDVARSLAVLS